MAVEKKPDPLATLSDPAVMRERADEFTQQMQKIEQDQANGVAPEDYKFLGFITMPAQVGAILKTFVNPMNMEGAVFLQDKAGVYVGENAHKVFKNPNHAALATSGAALAIGLGTQLSENIYTFWNDIRGYQSQLSKAAADVAPVLKDIKGSDGFLSLLSVTPEQNEVIYVRRQRLSEAHAGNHLRNSIGLIDKLPGAFRSVTSLPAMRDKLDSLQGQAENVMGKQFKSMMIGASGGVAPLVDHYKQSLKRSQQKDQLKPDALQMITALQETLKESPDAQEFEIPGARYNQVSLTHYIASIFKCHQEDMAKNDPACAPIRKQLESKLLDVADRLADAIRKGEITPLMLVRFVGERQIVKRGGRDIASMKDVEGLIRKFSTKAQSYQHVPEKEFFANFTGHDVQKLLDGLKGEERQMFMATLPDNILEAKGISAKEIKEVRDATGPRYKQMLAEAIAGLAGKDDAALEEMGLQAEEIQQARNATKEIASDGLAALDRLKASPTNRVGIEGLVHQALIGGKNVTMSGLAKGGKAALAKMAAQAAEAQAEPVDFSERERHRRDTELSDERGLHS